MNKKIRKIIEDLGWSIFEYGDYINFEKYSPAGEDYNFTVNKNNLIENIIEYAENFDPDEHAALWVDYRGTMGVPNSIRELLQDADNIKEMLQELANKLKGV